MWAIEECVVEWVGKASQPECRRLAEFEGFETGVRRGRANEVVEDAEEDVDRVARKQQKNGR